MHKINPFSIWVMVLSTIAISSCTRTVQKPYQVRETKLIKYHVAFELGYSSNVNDQLVSRDEALELSYDINYETDISKYLVFINIANISQNPVYIDLARSSFINQRRAFNYKEAVNQSSTIQYLPDLSYFPMDRFHIIDRYNAAKIKQEINEVGEIDIRERLYDIENSPIRFRNQITYNFSDEMSDAIKIDNEFWAKRLIIMDEQEFNELKAAGSHPNWVFYYTDEVKEYDVTKYRAVQEETGVGKVIAVFGGIVLGLLLLVGGAA